MTKFNKIDKFKTPTPPVGISPEVKIPPLDAKSMGGGMTMEQQASALRSPDNPLSPFYNPNAGAPPQPRQPIAPPPTKFSTLPPQVKNDPNFRHGVGSMYAANQPHLQQKDGGEGRLSPETLESLRALEEYNKKAEEIQEKSFEERVEEEVDAMEQERMEALRKDLGFSGDLFKSISKEFVSLDSDDLRKAIEARLKPLDVRYLVEEGEIRQDVPIIISGGNLVATYRTASGDEDLGVKRLLSEYQDLSNLFFMEMHATMQLVCSLYAINNIPLVSHLDKDGDFSEENFKRKLKRVLKYPTPMLASLSINSAWFDRRCRKLFYDLGPIKNG